jgi:hypothetical protein
MRRQAEEKEPVGRRWENMTKTDLIEELSNRLGLVKIDADRVVEACLTPSPRRSSKAIG